MRTTVSPHNPGVFRFEQVVVAQNLVTYVS